MPEFWLESQDEIDGVVSEENELPEPETHLEDVEDDEESDDEEFPEEENSSDEEAKPD